MISLPMPPLYKERTKELLSRAGPWLPALAAAATFAAFLPALSCGFLYWDDIYNMARAAQVPGLTSAQLGAMFGSCSMGPYTPLTYLTRAADGLIWGPNAAGHHLAGLLLHSANAAACYYACLALLRAAKPEAALGEPGLKPAAAAAALFFALHPLRAESVAWLSARHDVLCTLFWLLAVRAYAVSRPAAGAPRWDREAAPLAFFLCALLSKGMAITLPAVLLLLDLYPLRRLPADPRLWTRPGYWGVLTEKVPYLALAAVFAGAGYGCQAAAGSLWTMEEYGAGHRLGTVFYGVLFYPWKTLLPYGLSPFYQLPRQFTAFSAQGLALAAGACGLTAAAFLLRRRWPGPAAAWAYYLLTLAPVAGLVKINMQSAADRYSYLPGLAFAALAGAGLRELFAARRRRYFAAAGAALVLAALAGLSRRQLGYWKDTETLWRRALAVDPGIELVHNNLGHILAERGDMAGAEKEYREALRLNPASGLAHYNLGGVLMGRGAYAEAEEHDLEAVRLKPDLAAAHYNLGVLEAGLGRPAEAEARYREAMRLAPEFPMAPYNLGILLAAEGQGAAAEAAYRAALAAKPDFAEARGNLAGLLEARGDAAGAEAEYREALKASPRLVTAHNNLGLLLAARGDYAGAEAHYRAAIAAAPGFALAHFNLARLLAGRGRAAEAQPHLREALRLNPALAGIRK